MFLSASATDKQFNKGPVVLAAVSQLISVGLHLYLSVEYFGLLSGTVAGASLCSVGEGFSCEAAWASSFSALWGVPMSLWGVGFNGLLLGLWGFWLMGWSENQALLGRYVLYLSSFVAGVSVVMAVVSQVFVGSWCLFCVGAYVCSFVTCACAWWAHKGRPKCDMADAKFWLPAPKVLVLALLLAPAASLTLNRSFMSRYGVRDMSKIAQYSLEEWQSAKAKPEALDPVAFKGEAEAGMRVVEFADFLCAHCKRAVPSLKAFVLSRPGVSFAFYPYPLDGACNKNVPRKSFKSCFLSQLHWCAAQDTAYAWPVFDAIFEHQEALQRVSGVKGAKEHLQEALPVSVGAPMAQVEQWFACAEGEEAKKAIESYAEFGASWGVDATPSIFVNAKYLSQGQSLVVLETLYSHLNNLKD